jgi:release factor glutamine methyltransferase
MKKMHITNHLHSLTKQLSAKLGDATLCTQYAWWLLQAVTKKSEAELLVHASDLTQVQQDQLDEWVQCIVIDDKPLQYILGSVPFGAVDIAVKPPVLIPRPETEEWCMWLLHKLTFLHNKNITIIEPCTGSGCIAVALAHALPFATIYATDISREALALTRENAVRNNVDNILCLESDLFARIPVDRKADLILANPPYISESVFGTLDASVVRWEDYRALVAADNGLAVIKRIIIQAPSYLKPNQEMALHAIPQLMIEIGYDQAAAVVALMKAAHYTAIQVHKDLEGKDRVVSGRVIDVATTIP